MFLLGCDYSENFSEPVTEAPLVVQMLNCPFIDTYGAEIDCFSINLSEHSNSKAFNVPVVRFRRKAAAEKGSETLIYIPGGPGDGDQTSLADLEYWSFWYSETNISQDLLVFTPRGLYGANPTWNCDSFDLLALKQMQDNLSYEEEIEEAHAVLTECLSLLQSWLIEQGIKPSQISEIFSASGQARDVNHIAESLGYDRWHLWGVSYGSRVALHAAAHQKVESVVLDAPYPLNVGGIRSWAGMLDRSIQLWETHYLKFKEELGLDPGFDSFRDLFLASLNRLSREPILYELPLWAHKQTGVALSKRAKPRAARDVMFLLNSERLKSVAYFSLYSPSLYYPFLNMLIDITSRDGGYSDGLSGTNPETSRDGRYSDGLSGTNPETSREEGFSESMLGSKPNFSTSDRKVDGKLVLETFINSMFDPGFNSLIFHVIECADHSAIEEKALAELIAAEPDPRFPGRNRWLKLAHNYNICDNPLFELNKTSRAYYTEKPTLVFSGRDDPVTPPAWGEVISSSISLSRHIVAENASHGVLMGDYCDWHFWRSFLDKPGVSLEISCNNQ